MRWMYERVWGFINGNSLDLFTLLIVIEDGLF